MRYQGKITDWKDDKGFGFVMPNGGWTEGIRRYQVVFEPTAPTMMS